MTVAQPAAAADARMQRLLHGAIVTTLLRMAWPNVLVQTAQAATGLVETYWVAHLGTAALAGMALVFPGVMLMQMLSGGAMGGGISSAIARALGARKHEDAHALLVHALSINVAIGAAFTVLALVFGPALYSALGGRGEALAAALRYSNVVFAGMALLWLMNGLASAIRGTGNMHVPAAVICGGVVLLVPLSPCLIFGIGPFPALGIAGGGVALLIYYAIATAVLGWYVLAGHAVVQFRRTAWRARHAGEILRVGAVASLIALQTNLTIALSTAIVGLAAGTGAIAGFGTGARLEYLLVPLAFGFGAPLVALVGTNVGAGNGARATRIAWTGAALTFAVTEAIGLVAALDPNAWLTLFGNDPQMLATGAAYLRAVGPFYGFFGVGTALYFSSQGAGRLSWPLVAGVLRMTLAVGGGYVAWRLTGSLGWLFAALALALVAFGGVNAAAVAAGSLQRDRRF
jgi:putative MATE family efflux protein